MHMTPQDEDLPFRLRGTVKRIEKASQRARRKRRVRSSVTPPPSRGSSEAGDAEMLQPQNDQDSLHTPPASANGDSPVLKYEEYAPEQSSPQWYGVGHKPITGSTVLLPSISEFDRGVEQIARNQGPRDAMKAQVMLPNIQNGFAIPHPPPQPQQLPVLMPTSPPNDHQGIQQNEYYMHGGLAMDPLQNLPPPDWNTRCMNQRVSKHDRHINKKYTTEEGDFIIYAWHEMKLKWAAVQQEFARVFGAEPPRTIQGLQAWYYRMNAFVPVFDEDGWLEFDTEDDIEPKTVHIKCRDREGGPMGLAQRYPERAISYPWVDADVKSQAREWAAKRSFQYNERLERRHRKSRRSRL